VETTISIPDRIFRAAERAAKRQKVSPSRFYAQAVEAYLNTQSGKSITEALNAVYATERSELDPHLEAVACQLFASVKW
jgi:hypothetical protein